MLGNQVQGLLPESKKLEKVDMQLHKSTQHHSISILHAVHHNTSGHGELAEILEFNKV